MYVRLVFLFLAFACVLDRINGHGYVYEPPNRSSMWRRGFNTPINNDDNGLNCGHIQNHPHSRKINCGVCGDPKSLRRPRPNEHGGTYGLGVIGREYNQGSNIQVIVNITAAHRGRFTFAMCNLDQGQETEQCFEKYPLKLADGSNTYKLPLPDYPQSHYINLKLPRDLTCNHCVLRWQWIAGNNWGQCYDKYGRQINQYDCTTQETFRTCSDIRIKPSRGRVLHDKNGGNGRTNSKHWNNNNVHYSPGGNHGRKPYNVRTESRPKSNIAPTEQYYYVNAI